MSSWVARHGRGTSSDATGDTRVGKPEHDAPNDVRCRLIVVDGRTARREGGEEAREGDGDCVLFELQARNRVVRVEYSSPGSSKSTRDWMLNHKRVQDEQQMTNDTMRRVVELLWHAVQA
jgi:hypothetical protein